VNLRFYEACTHWKLYIDSAMVLRAMGAEPQTVLERRPRLVSLVERVLAEQRGHLHPRVAIREIGVREEGRDRLLLEDSVELRGQALCRRLAGAESIVAVVGTIGNGLEDTEGSRDSAQSLILEGLGTAAIAALTESILEDVRRAATERALVTTRALFPGMKGWDLVEGQTQIFSMVDGNAAGVSLNASFMMTPRKSVSFLVGIGASVKEVPSTCEDCRAVAHCLHKTKHHVC